MKLFNINPNNIVFGFFNLYIYPLEVSSFLAALFSFTLFPDAIKSMCFFIIYILFWFTIFQWIVHALKLDERETGSINPFRRFNFIRKIKKIEETYKGCFIKKNFLKNQYLYITKDRKILLIKTFNYNGLPEGDKLSSKWKIYLCFFSYSIKNPYLKLEKDISKINEILKQNKITDVDIIPIMVGMSRNNDYTAVDCRIVAYPNFYYELLHYISPLNKPIIEEKDITDLINLFIKEDR